MPNSCWKKQRVLLALQKVYCVMDIGISPQVALTMLCFIQPKLCLPKGNLNSKSMSEFIRLFPSISSKLVYLNKSIINGLSRHSTAALWGIMQFELNLRMLKYRNG